MPVFVFSRFFAAFLAFFLFLSDAVFLYSAEANALKNPSRFPFPVLKALHSLPPANVSIQDVRVSNRAGAPVVVLLQDIHMNAEAQRNIAGALRSLVENKAVGFVGVEGAFSTFDFSAYRRFPDPVVAALVANSYLEKNVIGAPSYVGVLSKAGLPPFAGVDDRASYKRNVDAYLASRGVRDGAIADLRRAENDLAARKRRVLSGAIARFDALRTGYHRGKTGVAAYVRALSGFGEMKGALARFHEATEMESRIDFARVEAERADVLRRLAANLSGQELSNLAARGAAYRAGEFGFGAYYRSLADLCSGNGVSLARFPAFSAYLRYVQIADAINAAELFRDLRAHETSLTQRLSASPEEKRLMLESEHLHLVAKLIDFSLTSDDWRAHSSCAFPHAANLSAFENFYREADMRSAAMARRLPKNGACALLSGGFHVDEIKKILAEADASYVVAAPKITKAGKGPASAYLSAFAREKTPLDKLFDGEKLSLKDQRAEVTYGGTHQRLATSMEARIGEDARRAVATISVSNGAQTLDVTVKKAAEPADDEHLIGSANMDPLRITMALLERKFNEWKRRINTAESAEKGSKNYEVFTEIARYYISPSVKMKSMIRSFLVHYGFHVRSALIDLVNDNIVQARWPSIVEGALLTLGHSALKTGLSLTRHPNSVIALAAIQAIRQCGSDKAIEALLDLIEDPAVDLTTLIAEIATLGKSDLLPSVLARLEKRRGAQLAVGDILPQLALMVSPLLFVAKENISDPRMLLAGYWLGFFQSRDSISGEEADLIRVLGMSGKTLLSRYTTSPLEKRWDLLNDWFHRKRAFRISMNSGEDSQRKMVALQFEGDDAEVDRELFVIAIREKARAADRRRADRGPFSEVRHASNGFMGLTSSQLHARVIRPALDEASLIFNGKRELLLALFPYFVANYLMPQFAAEERSEDSSTLEQQSMWKSRFRAQWGMIAAIATLKKNETGDTIEWPGIFQTRNLPVEVAVNDPAALGAVLGALLADKKNEDLWAWSVLSDAALAKSRRAIGAIDATDEWSVLSFGARSVLRLYAYILARDGQDVDAPLRARLVEFRKLEAMFDDAVVPTMGIELQMSGIPSIRYHAWKKALALFDIPSPERDSYAHAGNFEISFRPVRSAKIYEFAIPLIKSLMFGDSDHPGASVHMSFGGALIGKQEKPKYVALPLMFFGLGSLLVSDVQSLADILAWKLSKGIITKSGAVEAVDQWVDAPPSRLEIRVARWMDESYREWLPAAQFLIAAMYAADAWEYTSEVEPVVQELAPLWDKYCAELETVVADMRLGLKEIFDADWSESTGEHADPAITGALEITNALARIAAFWEKNPDARDEAKHRVTEIFFRYSSAISTMIFSSAPTGAVELVRHILGRVNVVPLVLAFVSLSMMAARAVDGASINFGSLFLAFLGMCMIMASFQFMARTKKAAASFLPSFPPSGNHETLLMNDGAFEKPDPEKNSRWTVAIHGDPKSASWSKWVQDADIPLLPMGVMMIPVGEDDTAVEQIKAALQFRGYEFDVIRMPKNVPGAEHLTPFHARLLMARKWQWDPADPVVLDHPFNNNRLKTLLEWRTGGQIMSIKPDGVAGRKKSYSALEREELFIAVMSASVTDYLRRELIKQFVLAHNLAYEEFVDPAFEILSGAGRNNLSREDEFVVFRALHARNATSEQRKSLHDLIFAKNRRLLYHKTKGLRLQDHDWDDIIQEMAAYLLGQRAGDLFELSVVENFEFWRGVKFSTHMFSQAKAGMSRYGRSSSVVGQDKSRAYRKAYRETISSLMINLERNPTSEELETAMGAESLHQKSRLKGMRHGGKPVSLDNAYMGQEGVAFGSTLPDLAGKDPANIVADAEYEQLEIEPHLKRLNREQQITLKLRNGIGTQWEPSGELRELKPREYSFKEIGRFFGVFRQRAQQIEARAMEILRKEQGFTRAAEPYYPDHRDVFIVEVMRVSPLSKTKGERERFRELLNHSRAELEKMWADAQDGDKTTPNMTGLKKLSLLFIGVICVVLLGASAAPAAAPGMAPAARPASVPIHTVSQQTQKGRDAAFASAMTEHYKACQTANMLSLSEMRVIYALAKSFRAKKAFDADSGAFWEEELNRATGRGWEIARPPHDCVQSKVPADFMQGEPDRVKRMNGYIDLAIRHAGGSLLDLRPSMVDWIIEELERDEENMPSEKRLPSTLRFRAAFEIDKSLRLVYGLRDGDPRANREILQRDGRMSSDRAFNSRAYFEKYLIDQIKDVLREGVATKPGAAGEAGVNWAFEKLVKFPQRDDAEFPEFLAKLLSEARTGDIFAKLASTYLWRELEPTHFFLNPSVTSLSTSVHWSKETAEKYRNKAQMIGLAAFKAARNVNLEPSTRLKLLQFAHVCSILRAPQIQAAPIAVLDEKLVASQMDFVVHAVFESDKGWEHAAWLAENARPLNLSEKQRLYLRDVFKKGVDAMLVRFDTAPNSFPVFQFDNAVRVFAELRVIDRDDVTAMIDRKDFPNELRLFLRYYRDKMPKGVWQKKPDPTRPIDYLNPRNKNEFMPGENVGAVQIDPNDGAIRVSDIDGRRLASSPGLPVPAARVKFLLTRKYLSCI